MNRRSLTWTLVLVTSAVILGACARTVVLRETKMVDFGLPKPEEIIVYDFVLTEAEVRESQGPLKEMFRFDKPAGAPGNEREQEIGRQVAKTLAEELAQGLRGLGFTVERKPPGTAIGDRQLLIDGEFLDVDEGNRLKRLVVGFGAGASRVDTEAHAYYGAGRRKLLDFGTHSDSGKMPGAAATMGAGAVVTGGVTAGMAATAAGTGAVKEYHSEIERMAAHSADQAVAYLSEFFAKQGWIRPDQVKKAHE